VFFRNKLISYGEELLAPRPTPSRRTTPFRLSATAYSIYSQLPFIPGGLLLHLEPEDAPCRGDLRILLSFQYYRNVAPL
jgi:hypothetical protein